jgi:hypothetical protein
MELIRSHDQLFKFVFGAPEQMLELLQHCLPPPLAAAIDPSSLHRIDGELIDAGLERRQMDPAFAVKIAGNWVILQLNEHKSWRDWMTALQVAGYGIRLIECWRRLHPLFRGVPAILPLVFYHGRRPWRAPRSLAELVNFGPDGGGPWAEFLRPLQLQQTFLLFDLTSMSAEQVDALRVSAITGLTLRFLRFLPRCKPEQAFTHIAAWNHWTQAAMRHPRGEEVVRALLCWYLGGIRHNHEQIRTIMNKTIPADAPVRSTLDQMLEAGEARGEARGEAKGLRSGYQNLFEGLLVERFGPLPSATITRIRSADNATIERWSRRLLTAKLVDDVFAND